MALLIEISVLKFDEFYDPPLAGLTLEYSGFENPLRLHLVELDSWPNMSGRVIEVDRPDAIRFTGVADEVPEVLVIRVEISIPRV